VKHFAKVATVVNDAHLFLGKRPIELSRLNEAERRVLRLLAEGHTAKSVATELTMTPAAVNERLREARRKTGVGSSRELARLLRAQENRHENIGVGRSGVPEATCAASDALPWRPQTGVLAMLAILFASIAGAAALMTQRPQAANEVDPLVGRPIERFSQPADLHAKVHGELPDRSWAEPSEAAIRARLMQIPLVGKGGNALRIICGMTLCEITGSLIGEEQQPTEYDPKLPINRAVADLQDKSLHGDLAKLGLKNESGSFISGEGKPDRLVFLLYYSRGEAK
jgi:DNA-binding CsgD family transcriptional regulator